MKRRRVAIVCPGRGTYGPTELGCLTSTERPDPGGVRAQLLARADAWRASIGRPLLAELDRRERFGAVHMAGENAAALIFTASAADARSLRSDLEVVAVCGNSMGWYTALHVAGCLSFDDGLRLVDTMGGMQKDGIIGGQVIEPVVDEEWRPDPERRRRVTEVLDGIRARGFAAEWSIHLGGFEVLAGEDDAVRLLLKELPREKMGKREYPFQLLGHAAFHTPLMEDVARRGREELADLPFTAPRIPLVDGRGFVFDTVTTRGEDLFDYTLGHQVTRTFDFTTCVRVVMREFAPDALVLLGPGDTLGGAIGQVLVEEGWAGIHSKTDFLSRQASEDPLLHSMGRPEQLRQVLAVS